MPKANHQRSHLTKLKGGRTSPLVSLQIRIAPSRCFRKTILGKLFLSGKGEYKTWLQWNENIFHSHERCNIVSGQVGIGRSQPNTVYTFTCSRYNADGEFATTICRLRSALNMQEQALQTKRQRLFQRRFLSARLFISAKPRTEGAAAMRDWVKQVLSRFWMCLAFIARNGYFFKRGILG